jgi:molybdate transport system substrate-binding protein
VRRLAAALAGLVLLAGCGEPAAGRQGTVTVFAAASLTEAFTRIGKDFEASDGGARVVFNFAGSAQLATQVGQGAPADVFASASPATMKVVTDAGDSDGAPVTFARNQLVIAVARGNPRGIGGLADLGRGGLKVAFCAEQVPCGAAAKRVLEAAAVRVTPVTLEPDVKAALSKVRLGEVDAALVYRTDARAAAAHVQGIEFPESAGAVNDYPVCVLRRAPNRAGATAFVEYVRGSRGKAVLAEYGFQDA